MPDATTPTFEAGAGGTSAPPPAPAAPTAPAAGGETFGIPNTTTPLTLTGDTSHTNVSRKVTTAQDAVVQGEIANAADAQKDSLRTQGELEAKRKLDEADTHTDKAGVYEANNKLRASAIAETEAQKAALAAKAAQLQKTVDTTKITDGWSDKTLGQKLLVSLALIVNGIGRGLSGNHGPDELFASIQEKIKHDHDEQIRKVDVMRKQIEHLSGPAREAAEKELKTRLENIEAQQIGQLARVSETGNALAARTGSPLVVAQMGQKMAEVDATAADKKASFLDKTRTEIQSGSAHESKQVQPAGGAKKDLTVQSLDGKKDIGVAYGPEESVKVHEAAAAANGFLGALKRYRDHLEKYGRTFDDDPAVQKERGMLRDLVVGQMTVPMKSGILNGSEAPRYTAMVDTPWRGGGAAAIKAVDALMTETQSGYAATAGGLARLAPGAEAVPKEMRAAPAGQLAPGGFGLKKQPGAQAPAKPAPAAPQETKQLRDPSTGRVFTAYKHADGHFYDVP
jgi:hypothetical protein